MSKKVLGFIIAVFVLAGAGTGTYFYFTNTPKNKYLLSELESYKDTKNYFETRYANEMQMTDNAMKESYNSTVTLGAEANSSSEELATLLDSSSIKLNVAQDRKNETAALGLDLNFAGMKYENIKWSADDEYQYLQMPILEKPLKFKNDAIIKGIEKITGEKLTKAAGFTNDRLNLNNLLSTTVTEEDLTGIYDDYMQFIVKEINDDLFKKEKKEIDVLGKKENLTAITIDLKKTDVQELIVKVLEKMKKDEKVSELVKQTDATIDFEKEISEMIKDVKKEAETEFPAIKSTIYIDGKKILKRDMKFDLGETDLNIVMDTKIDKEIEMKFVAGTSDASEAVTIEGTSKGDKTFKDDYKMTFNDQFSKITGTLVNDEKLDGNERVNDATLSFDFDGESQLELKFDQTMNTDTKANTQTSQSVLGIDADGEKINIKIDTDTKLKEDYKVDVKDAVDVNGMTTKDIEKLQENASEQLMTLIYGL